MTNNIVIGFNPSLTVWRFLVRCHDFWMTASGNLVHCRSGHYLVWFVWAGVETTTAVLIWWSATEHPLHNLEGVSLRLKAWGAAVLSICPVTCQMKHKMINDESREALRQYQPVDEAISLSLSHTWGRACPSDFEHDNKIHDNHFSSLGSTFILCKCLRRTKLGDNQTRLKGPRPKCRLPFCCHFGVSDPCLTLQHHPPPPLPPLYVWYITQVYFTHNGRWVHINGRDLSHKYVVYTNSVITESAYICKESTHMQSALWEASLPQVGRALLMCGAQFWWGEGPDDLATLLLDFMIYFKKHMARACGLVLDSSCQSLISLISAREEGTSDWRTWE